MPSRRGFLALAGAMLAGCTGREAADPDVMHIVDAVIGVDLHSHGRRLPHSAMYSDTYSAPLRAANSARNRER